MSEDPPVLTGRDMLVWLQAHPDRLDLPVLLLPLVGLGDAMVAEKIEYDRFSPESNKGWIVLTSNREVGDDD